ncbi:MAG: hypothetical protein ACOYLF_00905 [Blastocatellia bacterium]
MKKKLLSVLFLITLILALLSPPAAAQSGSGQPPAVVAAIRSATRKQLGDIPPRPLPLAGHWNLGEAKDGYTPAYQLDLIRNGHHILPSFLLPNRYANPDDPRWQEYYRGAMLEAARWRIPIALIGTQWEAPLSTLDEYVQLPAERNPNVILADGRVRREVSPLGSVEPWREVGRSWGGSRMMQQLQEWYPDPPLVLLISNNEHARLDWTKVEEDRRYLERYGRERDAVFRRRLVGDAWIERYRALRLGFGEGFVNQSWRDRALYVAYDAFGPAHFARWPGWIDHSLFVPDRSSPWPRAWDGTSSSFYLFNWSAINDFTVFSPQVESMNWRFMIEEAYRVNPNFWFELSTWDGHEPTLANDKRKFYASLNQEFTPERYEGMIQFGMWLLRPRVVREFRGYRETVATTKEWFEAVLDSVDRVHLNPVLRSFWQNGRLVANRSRAHPYQVAVPEELQRTDRWFQLATSLDPDGKWTLGTQLPVFALALARGQTPGREWLIYAHAPTGGRRDVQITVPDFGEIRIDVPVGGVFYLASERTRQVTRVNL